MSEIELKPEIGKRIKRERIAKGYSQARLGILCGWADEKDPQRAQSRISNYETGARGKRVSLTDLKTIADALEIDVSKILYEDGKSEDSIAEQQVDYSKISPQRAQLLKDIQKMSDTQIIMLQAYAKGLLDQKAATKKTVKKDSQ